MPTLSEELDQKAKEILATIAEQAALIAELFKLAPDLHHTISAEDVRKAIEHNEKMECHK